MAWGTFLVEIIKGLFSAPFIFGGIILYFLLTHRLAVRAILERLSSVSFPGGVKFDMAYPPTSDALNIQVSHPKPPDKGPEQLSRKADISENFEENFRAFLLEGIGLYRTFIDTDINLLWNRLMKGAFALIAPKKTTTAGEMLEAMKGIYAVDDRAIQDYLKIMNITRTSSTSELMAVYNKAVVLHEYFFRHDATRHQA